MSRVISDFVIESARQYPAKPAVWYRDEWMTYRVLAEKVCQCANYLKEAGIQKGDRVALLLENSFYYVIAYYGSLMAGAVVVPLNTDTTVDGLVYYLNHSGAKLLVTQKRFSRFVLPAIEGTPDLERVIIDHNSPAVFETKPCRITPWQTVFIDSPTVALDCAIEDTDYAMIIYTSGSTGTPKGVLLSHLNIVSNTKAIIQYLHLTENDRVMVVLPFYYIYGKTLLNTHMAMGGSVVIDNRFVYPQVILETMQQMQVTGLAGVPSTFLILLNRSSLRETSIKSLRYVTQAGGHMAPMVRRKVADVVAPAELYIMYGATEAAPRLTYLEPDQLDQKLASIGKAVPGVEVLVVNEDGQPVCPGETGEIIARGPNIMVGYWRDPEGTQDVLKDGWYYTGDLGRVDEEGYFYVVGRSKDIIKSGGYRVSAGEVEDALIELEAIEEVAVKGVEDETLGEAIKAYVVWHDGEDLTLEILRKFLRGRLPEYKFPRYLDARERLPKNESGKIMKTEL